MMEVKESWVKAVINRLGTKSIVAGGVILATWSIAMSDKILGLYGVGGMVIVAIFYFIADHLKKINSNSKETQ